MAVLICVPRRASAQSVTIPNAPSSLAWQDTKGAVVVARPSSNYPYGVSLSDCVNDYSLTFPIALTGFNANNELEVWAGPSGADCSDDAQRGASTKARTCWKVTPSSPSLVPFQTVSIKVRDIIANPATKTSSYVAQDASICGTIDYSFFDVYFLLTVGGAAQTYAKQNIAADTIGPRAVTNVSVTQGDSRLFVSWNPHDPGPSDATQFSVYYQATTADLPCAAPGLTSTSHAASASTVVASDTSSLVEIDGLSDGTSYAVAVAAQDAFLNDSNHPLVCQAPAARSGADGAGGGCAVTRIGEREGSTWLVVVAFVASVCAMRRKEER